MTKVIVTIPTYNEKANIGQLLTSILKLDVADLHILVIDDNSPDGTADVVREAGRDGKVKLLLRTSERGRGLAGRAGFIQALKDGADVVVEMDADLSHGAKYIPLLLSAVQDADVVLGSRLVEGGVDGRDSSVRKLITRGANFYIRTLLGMKVKDCNSGFRCFTRKALEQIYPEKIFSKGPSIVQEVLYKAHLRGLRIKEIPITFVERGLGKSKLGVSQLYKGYVTVLKLKWMHVIGKL